MKGHAVRAQLGEARHGFDGVQWVPCRISECVSSLPAHRPQSKREAVVTGRHRHRGPPQHFVDVLNLIIPRRGRN